MPIKFECPNCQRKLNVADAMAGKRGKCPVCQNPLTVPTSSTAAANTPAAPPAKTAPTEKPAKTNNGQAAKPPAPKPKAAPPVPPPAARGGSPAAGDPPAASVDAEAEAAAAFSDEPAAPEEEPTFIEFECEYCGDPIKMPANQAGKRSPCPSCARIIKVPELKKKEKKDWRSTSAGLPSAAKQPDMPVPEGTWASTSKAALHRESLEEAGVLDQAPPRTVGQKIKTWTTRIAVLALLGWGGYALWGWWTSGKDQQALKVARDYAASEAAQQQLGPEGVAALHVGTGDFYQRGKRGQPEKGVQGDDWAQRQYDKAFSLLSASEGGDERDLVLLDLALAQIDLAGSREEVDSNARVPWNDAQKGAVAALKAMRAPEARLAALRELARRLIARQEVGRALALPGQVCTDTAEKAEALARLALEFPQQLEAAGKQVQEMFNDAAAPETTASVIALALLLKQPPPKAPENAGGEEEEQIGKAEGLARQGQLSPAFQAANQLKFPPGKLRALLGVAAVGVESSPCDSVALEAALELVPKELNRKGANGWELLRLVELGLKADQPEAKLKPVADAIADPALRGRAQLLLFRARLAKAKGAVEEKEVEAVEGTRLAHALARQALAQHNTRRANAWASTIQEWKEPFKAFGSLGVALGLQPRASH